MLKTKYPIKNERKFNEFLVSEYLRYGSVDEVLKVHKHSLPISYAGYQRVLDKWDVVKAAGPHGKFVEAINFLSQMIEEELPLETIYKKMPPSFKTSAVTLYRILTYVKEGITRRVGTALVITPYQSKNRVLVANDISTPRVELGKPYGSLSIPMGFSRKRDDKRANIRRVLQQEVFVNETINKNFPEEVIPEKLEPFMYIDVADVRVAVYHLNLPKKLSNTNAFSSFKLERYKFMDTKKLIKEFENIYFRAGLVGAVLGYRTHLNLVKRNLSVNPLQYRSLLNKKLINYSMEELRI